MPTYLTVYFTFDKMIKAPELKNIHNIKLLKLKNIAVKENSSRNHTSFLYEFHS